MSHDFTPRFHMYGSSEAVYPPGAVLGPGLFTAYEFVWIIEGNVTWECEGVRYDTPPGTVFLMHPGTNQTFYWDVKNQSRHAFFMFDIRRGRELYNFRKMPRTLTLPEHDIMRPLFGHIDWLFHQKPAGWFQTVNAAVHQMLCVYQHGHLQAEPERKSGFPPAVTRALHFAREKWEGGVLSPPTLEELSRASGLSRSQMHRLFVKTFGIGPQAAMSQMRLDHASSLLARGDMPIKDIATQCGYESLYSFSKAFKKFFELSPREFRRKLQEPGFSRPMPSLLRCRELSSLVWRED
ncbi:MAG: AraC family transcriptional regulator [Verrucomicrobiae bacterium]|nr:AraC family transcriptional regulator [Verrucomicrobiae bacterium]